ncbi:MAG: VWA domain-containing protein [Blastocatellia bacterium]|nr:VWA domain-containing protein [Blastocatellia bacterium]
MSNTEGKLLELWEAWTARWPDALALWSKFTKLGEPRWCFDPKDEKAEGLSGSFAMIRLTDTAVVISLAEVLEQELEDFPLEIMGHEIGHHVYCPADLSDQGRMIARVRRALPTKEHLAGFIANLYADLLINDRLQRSAGLKMAQVFEKVGRGSEDRMWNFYMRIYEVLWSLQRGTLVTGETDASLEVDAQLGARVIRAYSRDWLRGAGKFAALCLPYLLADEGSEMQKLLKGWFDIKNAGAGGVPDGLIEIDPGEIADATHPAFDKELSGVGDDDASVGKETEGDGSGTLANADITGGSPGQCREPFEYGEILKSLGVHLSDHELAISYYRERAIPNLVRFPVRSRPESTEPLIEGLEVWDIGSPLEDIDWFESAIVSDRIIPGFTTVQRTYGTSTGSSPAQQPVDLDLYVDCSGSMPNPQRSVSYLTLAGAIISLSALRAGSRVQATLWSGKNDFQTTNGFIRDEHDILAILTGYIGGATAFPIHLLRDTYKDRKPSDRPVHILVISDDGVDTMFDADEKGNSGWDVSRMALDKGRAGGTFVLNLWQEWKDTPVLVRANKEGWSIHSIKNWEELVEFARAFSKANYGQTGAR